MATFERPDVLVLGAGGVLGEAWMSGVLAGAEEAGGLDFRRCEAFVGTSAGAIVAARLAAGRRPGPRRRAAGDETPSDMARDAPPPARRRSRLVRGAARAAAWAGTPLVPPLFAAGTPAGARIRALALARVPHRGERLAHVHGEMQRLGVRFDGRLRVCAVDRRSGRRVVFGAPGAPAASVADAVVASCAIPWVFRPVRIGGREYVDGGAWSLTNLDAAPAGELTQVLCLHPSGGRIAAQAPAQAILRGAAAAGAELEALALRARGATVRIVAPDQAAAAAMGPRLMDPGPARAVHAAGVRQGIALARG